MSEEHDLLYWEQTMDKEMRLQAKAESMLKENLEFGYETQQAWIVREALRMFIEDRKQKVEKTAAIIWRITQEEGNDLASTLSR